MEKIKQSNIKGTFYPETPKNLLSLISTFKKPNFPDTFKTRAVIVPHAGLIYSGELAYKGISLLDNEIQSVFIFAPSHRAVFQGISVPDYDFFETPFGSIKINKKIIYELKNEFKAVENNEAFEFEHSIEVQLPIIQSVFNNMEIVPVLTGIQSFGLISKIIEKYYDNKNFGFIISSDLSHFLTDEKAKKLDNKTADMIETGDFSGIKSEQACGIIGILGLVNFANKRGYSLLRTGLTNSSRLTNDASRVVGYGSWVLTEQSKNKFLKEHYSDFILNLAKNAVTSKGKIMINEPVPEVFKSLGACFVTLEKQGMLRGCIGSITAYRPLITDLIENARNAAFFDPRFKPVEENEFNELKIAVSVLSAPVKINFADENDLLNKIVKNKDGLIIKDLGKRAVYLPSVWEQISDKKDFLNSLKQKAGLPYNHFSKTFEAYKFYTTYIKQ